MPRSAYPGRPIDAGTAPLEVRTHASRAALLIGAAMPRGLYGKGSSRFPPGIAGPKKGASAARVWRLPPDAYFFPYFSLYFLIQKSEKALVLMPSF